MPGTGILSVMAFSRKATALLNPWLGSMSWC